MDKQDLTGVNKRRKAKQIWEAISHVEAGRGHGHVDQAATIGNRLTTATAGDGKQG